MTDDAKPPQQGFTLLDGATPAGHDLTDDYETLHRIAADPQRALADRLAAFEDVFESEVGDTSIARARNLERTTGLRQLFLKFEGGNPSGTQKDRIAFAQSLDAMRRGFDAVTVATCGNYGVAAAMAARMSGLRCIVYIPDGYHTGREKEMVELGAEIERVPGDYENAVLVSRERAERDEIYDANPGGANTLLQLRAYGEIAYEIYDELRDAPAAVAVPVSNGTTLALRPELVHLERAHPSVPRFSSRYLDFTNQRAVGWNAYTARISQSGVMGDPTRADADKGRRMWDVMIRNLVDFIEDLKSLTLDEIHQRRY